MITPHEYSDRLTDKDIAEFIEIWKVEFNETITPEEAKHQAGRLLALLGLLVQPLETNENELDPDRNAPASQSTKVRFPLPPPPLMLHIEPSKKPEM